MSEETAKIDKTLQDFLESVTRVMGQHAETLRQLAAAFARMEENQKLEHLNVKELGAMVNEHTHIFQRLDAAVKERLGIGEAPPDLIH
jgi:uncharacterized protein YjcR